MQFILVKGNLSLQQKVAACRGFKVIPQKGLALCKAFYQLQESKTT